MLDVTKPTITCITEQSVVTGQTIAKSAWGPRYRARLAAEWKLGLVKVDPTTQLAARVFGVSVPLVMDAIKDLEAAATLKPAVTPTNGSHVSDATIEWMIKDAGVDRVWHAIEQQLEKGVAA
jgi:hypothetical protein